ncbi:hypothetical protein FISHEDRAFT_78917 [Fistulina hepatica ATCC 64428]|uniref:Septin-type G domain-containing protein n=1 Tax=Fistulina hepatica ATCC 64428 TaxID=1128425 RepID=A0A0D6ZZP3_9AGAR|nr:hypothetical protein FISHEDRAFT_78917 [Fistulina hepatica ATCC 64428]
MSTVPRVMETLSMLQMLPRPQPQIQIALDFLPLIRKKALGYVGFTNVPNHGHRRPLPPSAECPKTISIESIGADIEENGVRLHLTVVDTPGFGHFVNNDDRRVTRRRPRLSVLNICRSWKPIVENIETCFESYLEQETRIDR